MRKHSHVLTPGRYVGAEVQEDDGEPFEEKMTRLTAQLREQQAEAARLDAAIAENLKALGFGGGPMTYSDEDIARQLRLGEDSHWEFKEIEFAGNHPKSPGRNDWADEIAAFANANGGVLLCGVHRTKARCRTCRVNSSSNWILCWSK